jgi:hypothetical protein
MKSRKRRTLGFPAVKVGALIGLLFALGAHHPLRWVYKSVRDAGGQHGDSRGDGDKVHVERVKKKSPPKARIYIRELDAISQPVSMLIF